MPPLFLFVNKDAASPSLTRSNAAEQTSINSHVQRGRRHRRSATSASRAGNTGRRTPGKEKTTDASDPVLLDPDLKLYPSQHIVNHAVVDAPEALVSSESVLPSKAATLHDGVGHHTDLPARPSPRRKAAEVTVSKSPVPRVRAERKPSATKREKQSPQFPVSGKSIVLLNSPPTLTSPRDISQVTSSSLDPFGQSVVKLDSHVAKLCRYFCESFHPSVWHAESWASREHSYTYQTSAIEVIQRAMQSEVEMNAMLACMAARIENVDLVPGQGTDRYMGNALVAVRKRFSSAPKHQLLLIVFHLYAADAYRQNYQAAKIHMQAAKALFDSWGGLDYVPDPALKELFIIGDGHMSAVLLEPCSLPCENDPGPYWMVTAPELQLAPQQDLSSIAPSFQGLCREGYLPEELVEAIQETAECTWVLMYAPYGAPDASKHAARWLQWRHAAVRYRLLAMDYTGSSLDAIRVGLLMWILTSMVILGLKRLGGLIAPKLRKILWSVDEPRLQWEGLVQAKTWVLTIGAMCSMIGSEEERWFVDQLFEVGFAEHIRRIRETHLELDTGDVLRNFQANYFYYDAIQRPRLERLARLISGGPSETPSSASQSSPSDASRKSRSPT
ncbi:hypothetical protein A1O7_07619 [Cladophialophora yegresii CBS 114405]|uniref:Transcription factor domain-containing protein n=1 Tax=Cladophialophora yegresii CBS 114405 TaxID=1182544 RepID=W9VNI3_9EURO|nr:uncharacterized protein A1O7_07619 [Cladophialophora yegresii CBS 114405]EXJ57272.1 hypothetical protein A1O7_07619 [Cladophialophora yegresii CBS 114405]